LYRSRCGFGHGCFIFLQEAFLRQKIALNTYITPVGTIAVLSFWMGLTLASLFVGYVMSKITVVRELIRL
jgi:hypothetical protein